MGRWFLKYKEAILLHLHCLGSSDVCIIILAINRDIEFLRVKQPVDGPCYQRLSDPRFTKQECKPVEWNLKIPYVNQETFLCGDSYVVAKNIHLAQRLYLLTRPLEM